MLGGYPKGIAFPESTLNLPTYGSTLTATDWYYAPAPTPISTHGLTPPLVTGSSLSGNGIPGLMLGGAGPTSTRSSTAATSTSGINGSIFSLQPVSTGAAWYHQPWTIPAAWVLCFYALLSCISFAILLFSGRLDSHGNLYIGRSGEMHRERMRIWREGSDFWDIYAMYPTADRDRIALEMEIEQQRHALAQYEGARRSVAVSAAGTQLAAQDGVSIASVESGYDPTARGSQRWSTVPLRADSPIDLQTLSGPRYRYSMSQDEDGNVVSLSPECLASAAAQVRSRPFDEGERQARLQYSHELQASMARVGHI
ncbi:hypothetical protein LTR53_014302 [Teratosphaeriaceae sp. CCFEE 6253]|nr:hypothetical protein LTR53_014302 [Teratosphaeriaceae sp. CCFEE 6253]